MMHRTYITIIYISALILGLVALFDNNVIYVMIGMMYVCIAFFVDIAKILLEKL